MYANRDWNSKGINKVLCFDCNEFFYVSRFGKYGTPEGDYMYHAADMLSGDPTSVVTTMEDEVKDGTYGYEWDNDYEKYDIMKRVGNRDSNVRWEFVKGRRYHEFMNRMFTIEYAITNTCPYCGKKNLWWSSIGTDESIYWDGERGKNVLAEMADLSKKRLNNIIAEAEQKGLMYVRSDNKSVDLREYLNRLVDVEKGIVACTLRFYEVYGEFFLRQENIKHDYAASFRPDRSKIPDIPPEPQGGIGTMLFGSREKKDQLEKAKKEYRDALAKYAKQRKQFDAEMNDFYQHGAEKYQEATLAFRNHTVKSLEPRAPIAMEKFRIVTEECVKLEEQLATLYEIKTRLRALDVVHIKYAENLEALIRIAEYIETGRCNELTGPMGAYNIYEFEHRLDQTLNNQELMLEVMQNGFENLSSTMQTGFLNLENKLNALDDSLCDVFEAVDNIRLSAAKTAHNSAQAAYYSQMAASSASTLEFLSIYDHLK